MVVHSKWSFKRSGRLYKFDCIYLFPFILEEFWDFEMFIYFQIQKFCGNDDTTRLLPLLIGGYKVIILTPQLLENNFIDNEIDGVEEFSMFVFDECHHAQKEDTYNKIMARYCKAKLSRKSVRLPQVGLLS